MFGPEAGAGDAPVYAADAMDKVGFRIEMAAMPWPVRALGLPVRASRDGSPLDFHPLRFT